MRFLADENVPCAPPDTPSPRRADLLGVRARPPGIVYFRFRPTHPEELADQILTPLAIGQPELVGQLSVLERAGVRQRALG